MTVARGPGPDGESQIVSQRRLTLLQSYECRRLGGMGQTSALLAEHSRFAGTALPSNLPGRAALIAGYYTAIEDLDGATVDELAENIPALPSADAAAALRALGFIP